MVRPIDHKGLPGLPDDLREAITEFEQLQVQYADAGADDSEPEHLFHDIIWAGLHGRTFDFTDFYWKLYEYDAEDEEEKEANRLAQEASPKLTAAAKKVYELTLLHNHNLLVRAALKEYAHRGPIPE